ncbi:actin-histidine N-methyltransferase-like [Polyodon spathula]|uniref:actin-histidine N-methyltransferase-like n=1 Tax=Polyodon spathula TaxID=7913 RepID=UPI001B7E96FB|nr:actin-histidine N-methyltransferase-like [Polyodon spathula]
MGKKSRVKTQKSGGGATSAVSPKDMMNIISELLQKCSSPAPAPGKEWEEYVQIRSLVEKIRKKQKGLSVIFDGTREDFFPELMAWAAENGASTEGFEIAKFPEEGFGLKATRDIKAEELFLWIPRNMLMTVESAKNSVLGLLYSQDRILQAMGNIALAFHLLCERADPNSFWLPYIKTLPSEYDTPLYFEEEEVHYLQSAQAINDVYSQYKNTARQYAYFYKVIQTHPNASKLPLKDGFTFDDYRWAVSSVMTRQNQIPTEDGNRVTLALIPLWDMCNHTNGLITTGYNLEDDRCECVALQDYKADEQAQDLHISCVPVRSSIFALHCSEPPISDQLLAFLRVFCMSEDELKEYLVGEHAIDKIFTLGNAEFPVSWDNEIKLWTFLETRAALLLKTYKTTSEADRSLLEKPDLSFHFKIAIKLRLAEKEILEKAVASGQAKREYFQKKLEEGAPLPKYEESNISMLENSVSDSKLPIILGKLEEADEAGEQELKMPDALSKVNAGGDVLMNGDSKQLNGTNTENEETLHREENAMKTDDAKENVEETTECNKAAEGQS